MENNINRRGFLKLMGVGVGSALLASTGYTTSVLAAQAPETTFLEYSTQRNGKQNGRILVAYASRSGSTSEIAHHIAETLSHRRTEIDLLQAKNVRDLSAYRMVVTGSAARMGGWLPEAIEFVERFQPALSRMPVAFFTVCMTLRGDTPENNTVAMNYSTPVRQRVKPFSEAWFAGKMDVSRLSFIDRQIVGMMKTPAGDFRDWAKIQAWAASLG